MTTREALAELAERGVTLTYWELRGMLVRGEVYKPRMSSALQWDWTEVDLRNVETAVVSRGDQPVNA